MVEKNNNLKQSKQKLCFAAEAYSFGFLLIHTYLLTTYTTTSANNDKNTDDYDSDVLRDELFIWLLTKPWWS